MNVWRNLKKIGQIHIPYKFAQSRSIPSKIKCEIFAPEGSQTIRATPDYYVPGDRKLGQRDLLVSTTMDQDFPGKVIHYSHFFLFISSAQWSVEDDDTIMGEGKNRKMFRGTRKRIDR